jgi:hypothetical protein
MRCRGNIIILIIQIKIHQKLSIQTNEQSKVYNIAQKLSIQTNEQSTLSVQHCSETIHTDK